MYNEIKDDFAWLRDESWPQDVNDPKVLQFLNDANTEADEFFNPLSSQISALFEEMKGRISEADFTVPVQHDDYFYYSYINTGDDYWTHARKHGSLSNTEVVLLNENERGKGIEFFKIEEVEHSPDHRYIAYSINTSGDERYFIEVKDIATGAIIDANVQKAFGSIEWHENSQGFFYIKCDDDWRAREVYLHILGEAESQDTLIYSEKDETFWTGISKTSSDRFLVISSKSGDSNEVYLVDLHSEKASLQLIKPRLDGILYNVSHHQNDLYISINDVGKNFRLITTSIEKPFDTISEVIAHNVDEYLEDVTCYTNHFVVEKRINGLVHILFYKYTDTKNPIEIHFDDPSYDASHIFTDFNSEGLRYRYSSLGKPNQILEVNFNTQAQTTMKVQQIPSGFDAVQYQVERIFAESLDGVKIPISLVYKKDLFKKDGSNPLYLYGYGSYGISIDPFFRSTPFSLVDRGFVFAIAHIRGGGDLGYKWYEAAKLLTKKKTFEDFISCAHHLVDNNYSHRGNISICGGSAGGMLIGAVINAEPQLFKSAILHVPFVDVLNTMLDETLPLTPVEFKEWGNPKDPKFFEYMKSYSPYDNIAAQAYPNIFMTAGLKDPRVAYWEPAKFYSKLKQLKTDTNLLLFKTNMGAGHFGKSARYEHLKEIAEEYAFVLGMYR